MKKSIFAVAGAAAFTTFMADAALAACTSAAECAQEAAETAASTKALFELLLPVGTIMAFNLDECPSGWTDFESSNGRILIGIDPGTERFALGRIGGRVDIPPDGQHDHAVRQGRDQFGGRFGNDNLDDDWATSGSGRHQHGGDNMPPYLAVKYCERT